MTAPVGGPAGQNDYLNACFRFRTDVAADQLFSMLSEVERGAGRTRRVRWQSRTADLDILLYGDQQIEDGTIVVPHPRMSYRRFVLLPACEIAGDMIHPSSGLPLNQLLRHLDEAPNCIVLAAADLPEWNQAAIRIRQQVEKQDWSLKLVSVAEQLDSLQSPTKLLVYFGCDQGELVDQARRFPGPTLRLSVRSDDEICAEIDAAIQAMQK